MIFVFLRKTERRGLVLRGALPRSLCHLGVSSGLPSASYVPDFPRRARSRDGDRAPPKNKPPLCSHFLPPFSCLPFQAGDRLQAPGLLSRRGGGAGVAMGPSSGTRHAGAGGFVQHNWVTLVSAHRPPPSLHAAARVRASVS